MSLPPTTKFISDAVNITIHATRYTCHRDMWDGGARGETLRGWFQKMAEVRPRELWNAEKAGYLVSSGFSEKPQVQSIEVSYSEEHKSLRTSQVIVVKLRLT